MKKLVVIIIVLIIGNNYMSGQSILGFIGGSNYSDIYETKISNFHYHVGKYHSYYSYAIEINYINRNEKLINYGMSLSYFVKSFDMNSSITGLVYYKTINAHFKLGYLSYAYLPEITFGNKYKFFFNLGPSLDLLINSSQNGSNYLILTAPISQYSDSISNNRTDYKVADTFSALILGLKSGLGLDFQLTERISFQIKTNFNIGISDFAGKQISGSFSLNSINVNLLGGISYKIIK